MAFTPPFAAAHIAHEPYALWRRLFMAALGPTAISATPDADSIRAALYATSVTADAPLIKVVDELVDHGLRADLEAFPEVWRDSLQSRVLDLGKRALLSYRLASLAAQWGWMTAPVARTYLPQKIDSELDPYGADLLEIFQTDLGEAPRFGHTPAQLRLALLRTAMGLGRPLVEVVTELSLRGVILPMQAVPASCREALKAAISNNSAPALTTEMVASWHIASQKLAEIVPLRNARLG
jgi:hypothetical protein